ncbi:MAG: TRAP transporter large permease [Pseudomonadota bacterium]
MTPFAIGAVGVFGLIALILLRVPIGVSLALVGYLGYASIEGWQRAGLVLGNVPLELASAYTLSVLPLFAVMGTLTAVSGLSSDLFRAGNAMFRGARGAYALSAIFASGMFGAVCGSSLATAAAIGKVSIPEMLRAGYPNALAAGAVAAGGTLGILIPPSLVLMVYAVIAQLSVVDLFAAALIPGLVLMLLYVVVTFCIVRIRGSAWYMAASSEPVEPMREAFLRIWHVVMLFGVTIGGIYLGWFTPTEAAAIGAFGALALGFLTMRLSFRAAFDSFEETVRLVASLTFIVIASIMFSYFVVQTGLSRGIAAWITEADMNPVAVIALVFVFYLVLGCFLEGLGMVLITVPILLPVIMAVGFDPVWFGVFLVVMVEIGLITPPVGMNLFVLRAVAPQISMRDTYLGALPYLVAPFLLTVLMVAFPDIALWLPNAIR